MEDYQLHFVSEKDVIRLYARGLVISTWGESEWEYFDTIIQKESQWKHHQEHRPELSSAYGLGGFLDSTWSSVGCTKTDDRLEQIRCTALYIEARYQTPKKAVDFHKANGWY